jgi:tetratricopeptide (TPR) repeat protein
LRLSPRDTQAFIWFLHIGFAKACLRQHAEALPWLRKSIDANRNASWAFSVSAACLAHLGRRDEARKAIQAGLDVNPKVSPRGFGDLVDTDNPVALAQFEHIAEGIRKAVAPE